MRYLELGIPATRRAPAPGGVDAAEMSPEGRGSRLYTDRAGESWDAAAQASEAHVPRSAGAPEVLVRRSRSRNGDGRGDVGRCPSSGHSMVLTFRVHYIRIKSLPFLGRYPLLGFFCRLNIVPLDRDNGTSNSSNTDVVEKVNFLVLRWRNDPHSTWTEMALFW